MTSYGGGGPTTYAEQQKKRGRKTDPRTMKRIIQAFSPYRSEVVTILAAILLTTLLGLVNPLLISHVFDDAIGKGDVTLLLIYIAIMGAPSFFQALSVWDRPICVNPGIYTQIQ